MFTRALGICWKRCQKDPGTVLKGLEWGLQGDDEVSLKIWNSFYKCWPYPAVTWDYSRSESPCWSETPCFSETWTGAMRDNNWGLAFMDWWWTACSWKPIRQYEDRLWLGLCHPEQLSISMTIWHFMACMKGRHSYTTIKKDRYRSMYSIYTRIWADLKAIQSW